jgi:serine protease Do
MMGTTLKATADEQTVVLTSPFTEAVAKARDSVVGVNNYQIVNNNYGGYNGYDFPWSYFGFGNGYGNNYGYNQPESSEEVKYGSGSGVVIAKEYVLTNYHVVDDAHSLKISIGDDEKNLYDASVAAFDEDKDVAVLYVPGLPLDPVELGDSDALQIGDWVVNIGNAIGFTGTATAGIVSGINREIPGDGNSVDKYGRATKVVNKMIQTDAAINSGNSGGGMFNTAGQLVGIPTLKYCGTRYSSNAAIESIGMCIPVNEAKDVIEQALTGEKPEVAKDESSAANTNSSGDLTGKPRMGVTVSTVPDTQGSLPRGVYVVEVQKDGPADAAGIQAGDIMVEINGQVITSVSEEVEILSKLREGDEVSVKVFRPATVRGKGNVSTAGEYIDLTVKLAIVDGLAQ